MTLQDIIRDLEAVQKAVALITGALTALKEKYEPADNSGEDFTPTKETLKGDTFLAVKEEFMPKIKNIYIYRRKDGYYSATVAVRNVRKTFVNKHKTVAMMNCQTKCNT